MLQQFVLSFFARPPRLPVLVMDPGPIQAAVSSKRLAQVLAKVIESNPGLQKVSLAGGDGGAFTFHVDTGIVAREFGAKHYWTKKEIVDAYNARCPKACDHYTYSLANRRLERVVAEVASLLTRTCGRRAGPAIDVAPGESAQRDRG